MDWTDMAFPTPEPRFSHAATRRNRGPILDVLKTVLGPEDHVLEIASGSGEHAVHFAAALPGVDWQPSDPTPQSLRSIQAWTEHEGLGNVRTPIQLDVTRGPWGEETRGKHAIVCINMIHIAPWEASIALFDQATRSLLPGGHLILYGPFKRHGHHTCVSNEGFDGRLRRDDRRWGVRDLDNEVVPLATSNGFELLQVIDMPANNLSVIWRRVSA
ncbi:DUF938 domain-containing protein [Larsenimonas rhizosphaerae]|uniref:DUF938 domain-containing protein n=1 Tax=Larsenimonas rhizosphaerae TaxID=2944682 RepID=A0AA41ZJQ8_9GAMM|nr:DUF938 domain-containing protein [Larsenimonas rhizosphaerae]MCM2131377.1 class I SAM-dependent methyltransferase [Larsenimonas rhizosphaerae]MCX2525258.1 DUF938 domain-containing protein [Larsenimonas rhizosphaerae]